MDFTELKGSVASYQVVATVSSLVGILSIVYLSVLDVSLYVDFAGLSVEITSKLDLLSLRDQMSKYGLATSYIDASIALLGLGSLLNILGFKFDRAVSLGSLMQISSILILVYRYNFAEDGSSSNFLLVEPTVWMYLVFALPVVTVFTFAIEKGAFSYFR